MDIKNSVEYKKCIFLASRRAMLENELLLKEFVQEFVPKNYTLDEIKEFNIFLEKIYDNDLFDVIFGIKPAEYYSNKYPGRFLTDIENFAFENNRILKIKNKIKSE
ncbi:succinate dehydrogenase assembly factor 2 [Deferribacter autotrophicus]|uniref:FAD assembly factor SdhE n=1 Tax=Deferribacter autotrophicus TaxID=500465 RepID=A0A5A8F3J4_9BACT|nr:succinate dehydrogenase assembly factor 2 [Deferribacter autotrophicus]KAA0257939.1 succinate dehydrogenase assembly factor 2 [Deferribacter autotrophicus]